MPTIESKRKSISAIIPIFNEEKTVKRVVEVFLDSFDLINEVICVNDGSMDRSLEILESFGNKIKLINLKRNRGKGYALAKGTKEAKGEIIVFWDADFPNLSQKHIKTLIESTFKKNFKAVLGVPIKNKFNLSLPTRALLTGERVYPKEMLLPYLEEIKKTRFGVEMFLNKLVDKKETKIVLLKGLVFPYKYEKRDPVRASKEYLIEAIEIAEELGKRKGILPKDLQIIESLKKAVSLKEFKIKIEKIKSKEIKKILKNYIGKYLDSRQKK